MRISRTRRENGKIEVISIEQAVKKLKGKILAGWFVLSMTAVAIVSAAMHYGMQRRFTTSSRCLSAPASRTAENIASSSVRSYPA